MTLSRDQDGYPTSCCLCGCRIVKTRDTGGHRFHYSHETKVVLSWHVPCEIEHGWPAEASGVGVD